MTKLILYSLPTLIAFCLYGLDKLFAKLHAWRIPEKILLLAAFFGGSLGAMLGMLLFHHKVSKPKFYLTVPIIFLLQAAVIFYFILKA